MRRAGPWIRLGAGRRKLATGLPVNAGGHYSLCSGCNPATRSCGCSFLNPLSLLRREFAKLSSGVFIALGGGFGKILASLDFVLFDTVASEVAHA